MIRKILSLIVIICLVLHCASRLGVVSYIYKNRHDIAQTLGLIKEKPIAFCNSNYFSKKDLVIHDQNNELPVSVTQAQEIILFSPSFTLLSFSTTSTELSVGECIYLPQVYTVYTTPVFHPPSLSA